MKPDLRCALGIAGAAVLIAACVPQRPAITYPGGKLIGHDRIVSMALAGNLVGDPAARTFSVYLPPGYDQGNERYPVLYLLQSFGGPAFDPAQLSRTADQVMGDGQSRQMILVFLDGFNRFGGSFYLSSPTIGDYETFITQELVNQVDRTYRTNAARDSRAISGCSMGGYGALHLAFTRPDVFSVVASNSGSYSLWSDAGWEASRAQFTTVPLDFAALSVLPLYVRAHIALAAVAASNTNKPPFYLDMPFTLVNGQSRIVPEVRLKVDTLSPEADLRRYLVQPVRLRGLMIYHGTYDGVTYAQAYDRLLSRSGVDHEYLQVDRSHCDLDWTPVLKFVSAHLAP